ncbi:MAG TPA: shikimate dehydrogenase [Chloroflexota bacterium]|nr:shikimate dehydrogenase [Chloroflexota bacterium]
MKPGQARKVVGLIGYPLTHSVSPRFQQAGFDFLELPVEYQAWETPPERVAETIERVRRPDCLGINVTVPHKQAVIGLLDGIDEPAARIGAVNTIRNESGRLTGFNTDLAGFLRPLGEAGFAVDGARAVVVGAGGAARAVAFALAWAGAAELAVAARRPEPAEALAWAVRRHAKGEVRAVALSDVARGYDLLVNCTSVGMLHGPGEGASPLRREQIDPGALVYDLVYNPPVTPLLGLARAAGARALGGLPMLVYQGAAAFEIWTGLKPPVGLMMARAEEALAG